MSILSFSKTLASQTLILFSPPSLKPQPPQNPTVIRMGGGPRTFPGGVSKWQWKRMQAKKSKQLLKARLTRERQIYEMRKRADLKAAVSDLERPWDPVEKPPSLFSVSADEQVKVLADRFQKPGGFDLWSDRDGPELFRTAAGEELPTARFFPKGVVHSVRPYRRIGDVEEDEGFGVRRLVEGMRGSEKYNRRDLVSESESRTYNGKMKRKGSSGLIGDVSGEMKSSEGGVVETKRSNVGNGGSESGRKYSARRSGVERTGRGGGQGGAMRGGERKDSGRRKEAARRVGGSESEVFDMRLREDGSYEFQ